MKMILKFKYLLCCLIFLGGIIFTYVVIYDGDFRIDHSQIAVQKKEHCVCQEDTDAVYYLSVGSDTTRWFVIKKYVADTDVDILKKVKVEQ